jgi:hypothetical protein
MLDCRHAWISPSALTVRESSSQQYGCARIDYLSSLLRGIDPLLKRRDCRKDGVEV